MTLKSIKNTRQKPLTNNFQHDYRSVDTKLTSYNTHYYAQQYDFVLQQLFTFKFHISIVQKNFFSHRNKKKSK